MKCWLLRGWRGYHPAVFGTGGLRVCFAVAGGDNEPPTDREPKATHVEEEKKPNEKYEAPSWLIAFVFTLITVVWSATFLAAIFVRDYRPPGEVHFVFLGMLGVLFGTQFLKGLKHE